MVRPANLSTSPETTLKALLWRISTPLMSPYCTDSEKLLCSSFLFVTYPTLTKLVLEKVLMLHWTKCSRWCLPKQKQQRGRDWERAQILVARQVLAVPFLRKHNVKQDTVSEERYKYLKERLRTISVNGKYHLCKDEKRMERDALTVFTLVWQLSPHTKCLSLGDRLACFRSSFVLASLQHSNWEHVLAQISYKFKSFQLKLLKHIPVYCNLEVALSFICNLLWCISKFDIIYHFQVLLNRLLSSNLPLAGGEFL